MPQRADAAARPGFGRRRLIHHAWIRIRGQRPLPCTVVSRTGSKMLLTFNGSAPAAHRFKLQIEGSRTELDCEVYYRKPAVLGVRVLVE